VEVTILGGRGSTPATGTCFDRYGGDTSSVAVAGDGEQPTLVLDAGTGLRRLGDVGAGRPFRGAILLTHLHWDHTHGLPFAPVVDHDEAQVDLYLPGQGADPMEVLARALGPPHFPITPDRLRGNWRFHALEPGRHRIGGFDVLAAEVTHKGGRTFGYRVSDPTGSLAYIPDYWQAAATREPTELVSGADLLLHDAQYLAVEQPTKAFLGHSTVEYAVDLAVRCGVGHLVLFHHDPSRHDVEIDAILSDLNGAAIDISAAAAGRRYVI
jgi:ribonuclease BN (tRNA processing enzyme)